MKKHAAFNAELIDGVICVVDEDGELSVTNDAEAVVKLLFENLAKPGIPPIIIYRDTDGVWDQLLVQNGSFAGFWGIGTMDRKTAIALAKQP